jgi:hypothetical protein
MLCRFLQHDKFPLKSAPSPIKNDVFVDIGFGVLGPTLAQCLERNTARGIESEDDSRRPYTLNSRRDAAPLKKVFVQMEPRCLP